MSQSTSSQSPSSQANTQPDGSGQQPAAPAPKPVSGRKAFKLIAASALLALVAFCVWLLLGKTGATDGKRPVTVATVPVEVPLPPPPVQVPVRKGELKTIDFSACDWRNHIVEGVLLYDPKCTKLVYQE